MPLAAVIRVTHAYSSGCFAPPQEGGPELNRGVAEDGEAASRQPRVAGVTRGDVAGLQPSAAVCCVRGGGGGVRGVNQGRVRALYARTPCARCRPARVAHTAQQYCAGGRPSCATDDGLTAGQMDRSIGSSLRSLNRGGIAVRNTPPTYRQRTDAPRAEHGCHARGCTSTPKPDQARCAASRRDEINETTVKNTRLCGVCAREVADDCVREVCV